MCWDNMFWIILLISMVGNVENAPEQTTEKETRPEYIHPDGLLDFDPYLSGFKPIQEEDDYIPLPENDETIDGLPIFLMEPNNSFVLRNKPTPLLCRAANALEVYFNCNDKRIEKTEHFEYVDPQNGVRVIEVEINVTRNDLDEYFGKYNCECYALNSKGRIRSQGAFIKLASPEQTTEKETRPEYIHPDGLLDFDPYLSGFKPIQEEDDYIPLPENDETIDGLPIFLMEPNNSFVLRNKPTPLLCRAANALKVYFNCNDKRIEKTEHFEYVDPENGVRVIEVEINVTRKDLDKYFGKYNCECYAWNSKGLIRSQGAFIKLAYIRKQFREQPQSVTAETREQVSFHCIPPRAVPPATIKWLRNGIALNATEKSLVLPRVRKQDMANYTCIAENIAGRRQSDVAVLVVYGKNAPEQTTEKETRPEYIHPDGLLDFDPYLSGFKPIQEEDDYIPLPENDETIDGLPIFLMEPNNSFVLRNKPTPLLCRAANALKVYFNCNDKRIEKTEHFEYVDPENGVRVIEVEINVTRKDLDKYFGKYNCECYAWNSKGLIRSQGAFIKLAYIRKQFREQPQSVTAETREQVSFHCIPPRAVPPATIKWLRNGIALNATEKSLVLPRVRKQDMANYTCIAENIAGRRQSDVAVLVVYGKNGSWSAWATWSSCSEECVRVRRMQCFGNCSGSTVQHAACVNGLCSTGLRLYNNNKTLFVGIMITMAMLAAGAAILYVWCPCRSVRPGYTAARTGTLNITLSRDKCEAPDLTSSCNEHCMKPDNHYEMPQLTDSYASPFGDSSRQQSSGSNHKEMKLYSPSLESASSCYNNSHAMIARSGESSSQIAEIVTSSPTSHSKVDVAVTLPPGSLEKSHRDKIFLTIV